ncbi:MAG: lysophospholipid acyltransferase family protein [Polaromonas sp.]|nr:lysophospholipid acyltransferase family protein [Polaromonas sp.]
MRWLFRFFSVWPLAALHTLGAALGWLVWASSSSYRAQFRANVAQAGLSFEAARPAIAHTGRFVAELPKLWMRPAGESCLRDVRIDGAEHAHQAAAAGHGVIFFGAHCGSFELASQALGELYGPVTAIYRPSRQPWLAQLERVARNRRGLTVLPADLGGIRLMHRALKANQAVALLIDQVPPDGQGVWAPFFGKPAYTVTLAARLALQTGAALLPVSCERLNGGRGYVLKIWPALDAGARLEAAQRKGAARAELLALVTRLNEAVEAMVLAQPDQYLWAYSRYKTPRTETATGRS